MATIALRLPNGTKIDPIRDLVENEMKGYLLFSDNLEEKDEKRKKKAIDKKYWKALNYR